MKSLTLIILALLPITCLSAIESKPTMNERIKLRKELLAPDDKRLSSTELKAIFAAKEYLESKRKKKTPLDARYKVSKTTDGYEVYVQFVGGYDAEKKPIFYPGGHCTAQLNQEFYVSRILPGA